MALEGLTRGRLYSYVLSTIMMLEEAASWPSGLVHCEQIALHKVCSTATRDIHERKSLAKVTTDLGLEGGNSSSYFIFFIMYN